MASDPNQGQPENPNTGPDAPSNPYDAPQNDAPQNPYATPENPFSNSYSEGSGQAGPDYGYGPPTGSPMPLGDAIRQLPSQWIRVLTHPGAMALAEESGKASWDIIWAQLIGYAIIGAIFSFLVGLENSSLMMLPGSSSSSPSTMIFYRYLTAGGSFADIAIIPIVFFIEMGIFYGLAKAFGGQGRFMTQAYTFLLFTAPIGIITSILGLIPIAGSLIGLAVSIYAIVLDVFAIMAVHRLSGGKATAVILIPIGVFVLLLCGLFVVLVFIIASAMQNVH